MQRTGTLLFTDLVDSTAANQRIGDAAMARWWAEHDAAARALMREHGALEIGRSDGFLLLFDDPGAALALAHDYGTLLLSLDPVLRARMGVHTGPITLRQNSAEAVAGGAVPYEVDGIALAAVARLMGMALPGQVLLSRDSAGQLTAAPPAALHAHGHWRLKGLAEPMEVIEFVPPGAHARPPPDSSKAFRVLRGAQGDGWISVATLPHALPAEADGFIGRGEALSTIEHLFDGGARLVTLLGLGGVGKTRLALRHARGWLAAYPGGAWFCDLSSATGTDGIVHACAHALGVPLGGGDAVARLGEVMAGHGECLIVLDNFEQVARHAGDTLGRWLAQAARARFLVTSREVLGLAGEHTLALPPLPDGDAGALFRTRSAAAGVALDAADEAALPALLRLLDGLPLAIELAAARARLLPPAALLPRMGERFKLLVARGGRRDRQATLRAALDWSWELLSGDEQRVLAGLSVFEGGFEIDDAEGVLAPLVAAGAWVPDLLQSLLEKSLLRRMGAGRLAMLRTVQDYAGEQAVALGVGAAARERHWRHWAMATEARATRQRGADLDNIVQACRLAAAAGAAEAAELLGLAWSVLRLSGPFQAAIDLAEGAGAALPANAPGQAVVHRVIGAANSLLGRTAEAREHYETSVRQAVAAGDRATWGETQCLLALQDSAAGRFDEAAGRLAEVSSDAAAMGAMAVQWAWLGTRGRVLMAQSRWAEAAAVYEEGLRLARASGDRRWEGGVLGNMGMVARALGRPGDARTHWEAGLAHADEAGDRQWAGNMRCNLGLLLHELGDSEGAVHCLDEALQTARLVGHLRLEATAWCNLALVHEASGRAPQAAAAATEAVSAARLLGDARMEAHATGYRAMALALMGQCEAAAADIRIVQGLASGLDGDDEAMARAQVSIAWASCQVADAARESLACAQRLVRGTGTTVDPELLALLKRAAASPGFSSARWQ